MNRRIIGSDEERWRLHLLYLFDGPPVPGVSVGVHLSHRYALKQQGIGGDSFTVVAVFLLSRKVLHHGALLMNINSYKRRGQNTGDERGAIRWDGAVVVEKEEDEGRLHALFTAEKGKTDDTACAYSTVQCVERDLRYCCDTKD
jgi:hypothetical protein